MVSEKMGLPYYRRRCGRRRGRRGRPVPSITLIFWKNGFFQ